MNNSTSFISKSIFNEFVEKTDNLNIEEKIEVLLDLLTLFDNEKTIIEDEISLELQNDPTYGIKDKMDIRYRNKYFLSLYKDCEPYLICKNSSIELNKEQINIVRLLNSKIRLEAKKQGLNDNVLQVAVHNEYEMLVVHHDTGFIEVVSDTNQLKLEAPDGKKRLTDVLDTQQVFRIIQSIPSKKAEPFKLWLAEVANQRLDQLQDPELSIEQAMRDYKRLGYSDNWINQRLKSIEIRKELTDEWKKHGLQEGGEFAFLTDVIYKTWAGKTAKEYKQYKGLKKENLRDNMTNKELVMNMLAELSTKEISEAVNPQSFSEHENVAKRGGNVAKEARLKLEAETGKPVVSQQNAGQVKLGSKTEN